MQRMLDQVLATVQELKAKLDKVISDKKMLEKQIKKTEEQLVRADKFIVGLADEKVRWAENIVVLND